MHFWKIDDNITLSNSRPANGAIKAISKIEISSAFADQTQFLSKNAVLPAISYNLDRERMVKQNIELRPHLATRVLLENKKFFFLNSRRCMGYSGGFFSFPSVYYDTNGRFINGFSFFSAIGKTGWTYITRDLAPWSTRLLLKLSLKASETKHTEVGTLHAFRMFMRADRPDRLLQPRNFARTYRASFREDYATPRDRTEPAFVKFYKQTAIDMQVISKYPSVALRGKFDLLVCVESFKLSSLISSLGGLARNVASARKSHFLMFSYPQLRWKLMADASNRVIKQTHDKFKNRLIRLSKSSPKLTYVASGPVWLREFTLAQAARGDDFVAQRNACDLSSLTRFSNVWFRQKLKYHAVRMAIAQTHNRDLKNNLKMTASQKRYYEKANPLLPGLPLNMSKKNKWNKSFFKWGGRKARRYFASQNDGFTRLNYTNFLRPFRPLADHSFVTRDARPAVHRYDRLVKARKPIVRRGLTKLKSAVIPRLRSLRRRVIRRK